MSQRLKDFLRRRLDAATRRRWRMAVDHAQTADIGTLKSGRAQATRLRRQVDAYIHIADGRLRLPRIDTNAIRKPAGADWAYRPEIWRGPVTPFGIAGLETKSPVGTAAMLYHDCPHCEITVRQIRNTRSSDLAPFGLRLDVFRFDGSFLSLMLELPDSACDGLRLNHFITLNAEVDSERPLTIVARLNIKSGPNVEQIVRSFAVSGNDISVDFDLAQTRISEKRLDRLWLDLIFEDPSWNEITLRDITLSRRPGVEF